jgi:hypothetical protein
MITRKWTFGQRVGAGFATMIMLTLLTGSVGVWAVESVVSSKDVVIAASVEQMVNAERLRRAANETMAAYRAFLLTSPAKTGSSTTCMRRAPSSRPRCGNCATAVPAPSGAGSSTRSNRPSWPTNRSAIG